MKRDTGKRISVEDLLRLKKAERPPPEFWGTFEAEIRAKQLSAIVNKRPWWDGIAGVFAVVGRHQLPFGAAAALALTWVGVQYVGSHPWAVRAPAMETVKPMAAVAVPAPAAPVMERAALPPADVEVAAQEVAPSQGPVVAATASHVTQAPSDIRADSVAKSPFADGFAVTLADYHESALDLAGRTVFGSDREFETSVAPACQPPAEPLTRLDPSGERRARLLAPALPAFSSGNRRTLASDWMRERASSDERMYESIDRGPSDRMLVGFRF